MATDILNENWTLDESTAKKILMTPRTKLPESNVFNDIHLTESQRIAKARQILDSRRK